MSGPQEDLSAYRQSLIAAEQSMQGEYDKGVLAMSGGALGVSLVFLNDFIGSKSIANGCFLLAAWIVWGLSIVFVLASYFTSTFALRRAYSDASNDRIYNTAGRSCWATATLILNALGGISFFAGVVCFVAFVACNLNR
jgi:hypothetical protein